MYSSSKINKFYKENELKLRNIIQFWNAQQNEHSNSQNVMQIMTKSPLLQPQVQKAQEKRGKYIQNILNMRIT